MTNMINEIAFNEYKFNTRNAMRLAKEECESDTFIQHCRAIAWDKVNNAIDDNGNVQWAKLPKLIGQNTKIAKDVSNTDTDLEIWGLSLAPHYISGFNTCNGLSNGCAKACLMFTGMGQKFMIASDGEHKVAIARIIRTILWFKYRDQFKAKLLKEIQAKAKSYALKELQWRSVPMSLARLSLKSFSPNCLTYVTC